MIREICVGLSAFARLNAESGGDGGEDGDEEVDDGFPIFFFHDC